MTTPKSKSSESDSILSNFRVSSRRRQPSLTSKDAPSLRAYLPLTYKTKQYTLNGVDIYSKLAVINREVEAIYDTFSVKGAYLYIRKGSKVIMGATVGEYCYITINGHVGYFPTYVFRHV